MVKFIFIHLLVPVTVLILLFFSPSLHFYGWRSNSRVGLDLINLVPKYYITFYDQEFQWPWPFFFFFFFFFLRFSMTQISVLFLSTTHYNSHVKFEGIGKHSVCYYLSCCDFTKTITEIKSRISFFIYKQKNATSCGLDLVVHFE